MTYNKKTKSELIKILNKRDQEIATIIILSNKILKFSKKVILDSIHQMNVNGILKFAFWVAGIGLGVVIGVII